MELAGEQCLFRSLPLLDVPPYGAHDLSAADRVDGKRDIRPQLLPIERMVEPLETAGPFSERGLNNLVRLFREKRPSGCRSGEMSHG